MTRFPKRFASWACAGVFALCFGGIASGGDGKPMEIARRIVDFSPQERSLKEVGIGEFSLARKAKDALSAAAPADWKPTGIGRKHYLDTMEIVVKVAKDWVDAQGAVVDPILGKEVGQTTPRFVSSGALLLHFGRGNEAKEAVFRAMDYCCDQLPSGKAAKSSPDFWMRELATAYMALETVADRERLDRWAKGLGAVEPERIYTRVSPDGKNLDKLNNWAIYASAGEAMRQAAGLKPGKDFVWGDGFFDKYVGAQFGNITENGMYRDPGDPITYDITTRLQMASALAFGYEGKLKGSVEEVLRRGGLTMLLFVSPEGFVPFGGRSAAFNFREAIVCALCELEARRYRTSDPRLAGAFKRQAHLSAVSIRRWMAGMNPWRHIKNGFDPSTRHGIDSYGNYSVYSLLVSSFLGLAAVYADDTIAEAPCPSETGGFAFELTPAFHKVFANCAGAYIEIDTAADLHYDATGLGCFAVKGVPLELGLAMPLAGKAAKGSPSGYLIGKDCKQPDEPMAIGPSWEEDGKRVVLAGLSGGLTHTFRPIAETPRAVQFEVAYRRGGTSVTEEYRLEPGKVTVKTKVTAGDKPAEKVRFVVPLLVTDGSAKSQIGGVQGGAVSVKYMGHACGVRFGEGIAARIDDAAFANRNAVYRALVIEPQGNEISVEISLR